MNKLETGILTILWNEMLERLQATSASLQSPDQDLNTGYMPFMNRYTGTFKQCDRDINQISRQKPKSWLAVKNISNNTKGDYFSGCTTLDQVVENQTTKQKSENRVFIVVIDNILSALAKRMEAYHQVTGVFGIFRKLKSLTAEEILKRTPYNVSAYQDDLEESRGDELVYFAEILKTDVAAATDNKKHEALELQYYRLIMDNTLESCFPNVEMLLRIYLSLMITNWSGERSFSKLKHIKNKLRNTIEQDRLNNITLMNTECDLLRETDSSSIIY